MFCPNCGNQIPNTARVCGQCGYHLAAAQPQPTPAPQPPPQPIIVQAGAPKSTLGCGGLLNLILAAVLIGAIGFILLALLCVIRLPAQLPLFNASQPLADLWSRAVAWQSDSCVSPSVQKAASPNNAAAPANTTADICNSSKFVSETIPDHTVFSPGETYVKTWTVRNAGTCTWTTAYTFRFTQGERMGGAKSTALNRDVKPNETYTFSLDLTAPGTSGTYTGRWEIFDNQGNSFGWYSVVIDVVKPGEKPQPPKEATVIVNPSNGPAGTDFTISFSGYPANASVRVIVKSLDTNWVYNDFSIKTDNSGKGTATIGSDVFEPGQLYVEGTGGGITGSAVFIVEGSRCNDQLTYAECISSGGQWAVIRMDPGPNKEYCRCPGQ